MKKDFLTGFVLCCLLGMFTQTVRALELPTLNWTQRSDWVNVKTDVSPAAVGDGVADDTTAIQAAINMTKTQGIKTVYFPPGTYRITQTLDVGTQDWYSDNVAFIGHGKTTVLKWDGAVDGTMLLDIGSHRNQFIGFVFDANNKAGIGIDLNQVTRQSELTYRYLEFKGFSSHGMRTGQGTTYISESEITNCIFRDCGVGLGIYAWNDYNINILDCEFIHNGIGIHADKGNATIRQCHFEASTETDFKYGNDVPHSIRRSTSYGSARFISGDVLNRFTTSVDVQDCQVGGWTDPDGAIHYVHLGTNQVYDTVFSDAPTSVPPILLGNRNDYTQQLITSANEFETGTDEYTPSNNYQASSVPAGLRNRSLISPHQRFFRQSVRIPGQVFDAMAYGAVGDNVADDTAAIQATIDAAAAAGNWAIAYIPAGKYRITSPLIVDGGEYYVGGSGYSSRLYWDGGSNSCIMSVSNPQDVVIELLSFEAANDLDNTYDIYMTGGSGTQKITLDRVWGYTQYGHVTTNDGDKGIKFESLPTGALVNLRRYAGYLTFENCSQATNICTFFDGQVNIGGNSAKTGMTGIVFLNTGNVTVRDNQDLIIGDRYSENCIYSLKATGDNTGSGRISIHGFKMHTNDENILLVDGYGGRIAHTRNKVAYAPTGGYIFDQNGTSALNMLFLGTGFSSLTDPPVFTLDTATLSTLECKNGREPYADQTPIGLLPYADVYDDYRELADYDLVLNNNYHKGIANATFESDTINATPAGWTPSGESTQGGMQSVTVVSDPSDFGGSQSMHFLDTSTTAPSRLALTNSFTELDKESDGTLTMDLRINTQATGNGTVYFRVFGQNELFNLRLDVTPTSARLRGSRDGSLVDIQYLQLDQWYRITISIPDPSLAYADYTVNLKRFGEAVGQTYRLQRTASPTDVGIKRLYINTATSGDRVDMNLDNVFITTGLPAGVQTLSNNSSFENDTVNTSARTALGTDPVNWTTNNQSNVGGIRDVCVVPQPSDFGGGSNSMLFFDNVTAGGSRLEATVYNTEPDGDRHAVMAFDMRINHMDNPSGKVHMRLFTNSQNQTIANLSIAQTTTGATITSNNAGVTTTLQSLTEGVWYRIEFKIPPASIAGQTNLISVMAYGESQANEYAMVRNNTPVISGARRLFINADGASARCDISFDNVCVYGR